MANRHLPRIAKELNFYLRAFGIPTELWGKGETKTIEHLVHELKLGESNLTIHNGKLARLISMVVANVQYENLILIEERQEFKDGRIRNRNLEFSLGEKILSTTNESLREAVTRMLKEELGITTQAIIIGFENNYTDEKIEESQSYPGLITIYKRTIFKVILRPNQFKPEGYIERQKDKTTYFIWKDCDDLWLNRQQKSN